MQLWAIVVESGQTFTQSTHPSISIMNITPPHQPLASIRLYYCYNNSTLTPASLLSSSQQCNQLNTAKKDKVDMTATLSGKTSNIIDYYYIFY